MLSWGGRFPLSPALTYPLQGGARSWTHGSSQPETAQAWDRLAAGFGRPS